VQGKNSRGRYSNMRYTLLDFVSLGMLTNRTVVLAPLAHSPRQCAEPLEELWDWPALNALHRVLAPPPGGGGGVPRQRLTAHCGPGAAEGGGPGAAHLPTMLRNVPRQGAWIPHSTSLAPSWGQWKVAGGVPWAVEPVGALVGEAHNANSVRSRLLGRVAALANATCVGLSTAYWIFPTFHEQRMRLGEALRPAPGPAAVIAGYLAAPPLAGSDRFVGVHMRLGDIGFANATACRRNISELVQTVKQLQAAHALTSVVLGTDAPATACAAELRAALPATLMLASGVYHADSCAEAQFVQEVLARAHCFIGTANSSFSQAVAFIRGAQRARNSSAWPPPCTIMMEAGQVKKLW